MNNPSLDDRQIRIARARTVQEWAQIYVEVIEEGISQLRRENPKAATITEAYLTWRDSRKPTLKRIVAKFQSAGLDLTEQMEVAGPEIVTQGNTGEVVWSNPSRPIVRYYWPDGSMLELEGDEAVVSVNFFIFWQAQQQIVIGGLETEKIHRPATKQESIDYFKGNIRH